MRGGSFTTISEAMSEWKAARQVATAPLREPAPPAISDRLADLGADVWAIALDLAGGRLRAEREALESARVEMESQQAEAAELADQIRPASCSASLATRHPSTALPAFAQRLPLRSRRRSATSGRCSL